MLWALRFQGPRAPYGCLSFLFLAEDLSFFLFLFFFFLLVVFPPRGGCRIYQTEGGGAHPEPQRRRPCRPMWQGGVLIRGGADASICPRALETLGTPLLGCTSFSLSVDKMFRTQNRVCSSNTIGVGLCRCYCLNSTLSAQKHIYLAHVGTAGSLPSS